ncbi:hypothetical protein CGRA01v4_05605 [Colletotrichum graminicola]|nr:hypothetical protein CGRA01v4_05605 [Colletotrichum graminicola]
MKAYSGRRHSFTGGVLSSDTNLQLTRMQIVSHWICYLGQIQCLPHRVAIRPHTLGLLQAISYFLFLFFIFWEQERMLYSSRSIAKK